MLEAAVVGVSRWIGGSIASDDRSQKAARMMLSVVTDEPVVRPPFEEDKPPLSRVLSLKQDRAVHTKFT